MQRKVEVGLSKKRLPLDEERNLRLYRDAKWQWKPDAKRKLKMTVSFRIVGRRLARH
jgi:hypothetical protein